MPQNFADRLTGAMLRKESQLCVGLDPRLGSMPPHLIERYRSRQGEGHGCGRREVAGLFEEFCQAIIEAVAPYAVAIKPQVACFEPYGAPGIRAFKHVCEFAAERGLVVIADVKRGDIGISAAAYSAAWLGRPEGLHGPVKPFPADAITVNPLFGTDGISPFLSDCREYAKGIFILVKTSNPGAADLQDLEISGGGRFHEQTASLVAGWGRELVGDSGYSSVGAVVGATHPQDLKKLRKSMPGVIFLVPGAGAQGGGLQDAAAAFDKEGLGALIAASRSIIYVGSGEGYAAEAAAAARSWKEKIWAVTH